MIASPACPLEGPFAVRLISQAGSLHVIVLPPATEAQKICGRIDIARSTKNAQLFGVLTYKREAANIACGTQREIKEGNGRPAEERILVVASLQGQGRAAQLDRIRNRKRAEIVLCAVVRQADNVVQSMH